LLAAKTLDPSIEQSLLELAAEYDEEAAGEDPQTE
jgi:hypothetical protein